MPGVLFLLHSLRSVSEHEAGCAAYSFAFLASTHVRHECLLPMLRTSCFVPRAMHPCYAERVYERAVVLLLCRTALASTLLPASGQRKTTVVLHLTSARRESVGRAGPVVRPQAERSEERKRCESPRRAIAKGSPKRTCLSDTLLGR